jgi:multicomponent Na+:H+ antiporter subunit C
VEAVIAVLVGILISAGVYLMLSRNLVRFLFGLVLVTNAANLLLFAAGRLTFARPPLVPAGLEVPQGLVANALPQALILTAIVIGFGLVAFALILSARTYEELGTGDITAMRVAEPEGPAEQGGPAPEEREP